MPRTKKAGSRKPVDDIEWSTRALRDLEAIDAFITQDDPVAANRWVMKLIDRAERAAKLPSAGRVVPEIGHGSIREVRLKTYRIVYAVHAQGIKVLTVFEGHKLLADDAR